MKSHNYILELENLYKNFDNNFEVVKNINLKVKKGEFVCFIGPSGSGKTILLYTIAGFLPASSGKIYAKGKEVDSVGLDRIMVFQDHMLFPWKTVIGNILFGLTNSGLTEQEKHTLAEEYLELVDLSKFKDWPIHKLSGGMKQRVAFARALVTNPEILLMDEPFSSLDSIGRRQLRKNLIKVWQKTKKTILFVTHSINEALYMADTIYIMSSRPITIKKCIHVELVRPRDMSDPNFVKLLRSIEDDVQLEFDLSQNIVDQQINISSNII
jgi:NitT/TauT family transport system ATP-binding protein